MKRVIGVLSGLILFFGIVCQAGAADVAKIGIVNFQRMFDESSAGKIIKKQVNEKGAEFQKKLIAEKNQLDELQKAFEREKLVLTPEKIREKQRDFRIRANDFTKMREDFAKEFKKFEVKLAGQMQKEVVEIANEIGKAQGYLLILEKRSAGVIYSPDHIDITDKVMKQYNQKLAKEKK